MATAAPPQHRVASLERVALDEEDACPWQTARFLAREDVRRRAKILYLDIPGGFFHAYPALACFGYDCRPTKPLCNRNIS